MGTCPIPFLLPLLYCLLIQLTLLTLLLPCILHKHKGLCHLPLFLFLCLAPIAFVRITNIHIILLRNGKKKTIYNYVDIPCFLFLFLTIYFTSLQNKKIPIKTNLRLMIY